MTTQAAAFRHRGANAYSSAIKQELRNMGNVIILVTIHIFSGKAARGCPQSTTLHNFMKLGLKVSVFT
ncbi:hypothetical protein PAMP_023746 [Pampus punctatissimus]